VPDRISDSFGHCLETIYRTCMILSGWFARFLPVLTFAMVAQHAADVGKDTLLLMVNFLIVMAIAAVLTMGLSLTAIAFRSGKPFRLVIRRGQEIAGMSLSTNSSTACIPVVIDSLIKLGFRRDVMELIVPLSTALVRAGPIVCYVAAPLFIAQLYGRALGPSELVFLFASAALLGSTTAGMSGVLVLTQIGIICKGLNLPFEAAFVLFASVDSFTDTLRTLMLVFGAAGAAAMITPRLATVEDDPVEDSEEPMPLQARPA
jgi:proton glutamate symport protein